MDVLRLPCSAFILHSDHSTQDPEKSGQGRESSPLLALWSKREKGAKVKPRQWGLIAAISALFLAVLAIPAISNSDNSDIVSPSTSQSPSSSPSATPTPTGSIDSESTPSKTSTAPAGSAPSSPNPDPTTEKDDGLEIPRDFVTRLIGMNEADAKALIWKNNYMSRVVHRDGEDFMVTADYRYDRINLYINGGIVFDATVG